MQFKSVVNFVIINLMIQTGALHLIAVHTCTNVLFFGHISLTWFRSLKLTAFTIKLPQITHFFIIHDSDALQLILMHIQFVLKWCFL